MCLVTSEESGFNGVVKNTNSVKTIYHDNIELQEIHSNLVTTDLSFEPYNNWTEKEIFRQGHSIEQCMNFGSRLLDKSHVKLGGLDEFRERIKNTDNLILLGCGSSYYSALLGSFFFRELTDLNIVLPMNACEFEVEDIPKFGKTAILFISQSGETRDLSQILSKVKDLDILKIGLVNTVNSLIANEADCGVYLNIGKEHGVASTKSFTAQSVLLSLIAIYFAQVKDINEIPRRTYIEDIGRLDIVESFMSSISDKCKSISEMLEHSQHLFVVGKKQSEVIALEASLKIKEITYLHAEGYSASMLKHGPFSLLDEKTYVIIIMPDDKYYSKTYSVLEQILSRKSPVILLANKYIDKIPKENTIIIPKLSKLGSILNIIPIQLIAYYLSVLRNINPDFPKNLAKVVTVD